MSGSQAQIPEVKWEQDLSAAIQRSKSEEKLILIHFSANWSKKSSDIKAFVFKSSRVVRAVQANVIPVMIDVDQFPELAREYGVEEVPYDIVLTPGKRVVARRPSPNNSDGYALMIEKLDRTINLIKEKGLGYVDKNVDGMHELVETLQQPQKHRPFAADGPSTPSVTKPFQAGEMSRKSQANLAQTGTVITNQHFARTEVVSPSHSQTEVTSAKATDPVSATESNSGLKIINNKFFQQSNADQQENRLTASTMTPNLVSAPLQQESEAKINLPSTTQSASSKLVGNPNLPTAGVGSNHHNRVSLSIPTEGGNQTTGYVVEDTGNITTTPLALKGHCPVTLIKEKRWVKGEANLGCFHRERLYLFADQISLKEFQAAPDAFSPLLAGYDPVELDKSGQLVVGKEEHGAFLGSPPNYRVVLFSSQENRIEFESNPRKYIDKIRTAMQQTEVDNPVLR